MKTTKKRIRWYETILVACLAVLLVSAAFIPNEATAADKKIKIGVIGPMKFPRGQMAWYGAKLATDEINAAGGIDVAGKKRLIELIKADSNEFMSIPDAVSTMERLVMVDKVNFVVGGCRTEACLAQQEVMADYKVIWGNGGGIASPVVNARVAKDYERYKYWFRIHASSIECGRSILSIAMTAVNAVKEKLGIEKPRIALLMEKTKWVDPIVGMSQKFFPKMGMEVVGVWRPSSMATDVSAELLAIKAADAHVIFQIMSGPVGVAVGKQWGELKIPAALAGFNTSAQRKDYWEATGGMCNYETTFHFVSRVAISPKTVPFFEKFEAAYKTWPEQDAANYDVIYVLKKAIEQAGTLNTDAVIEQIEKMKYVGAFSTELSFNPKEDWAKVPHHAHDVKWGWGYITFVGVQWQNGELKTVWPDGRAVLGDKSWIGKRYKGSVDYELPPWMVKYWKEKGK